MLGIGVLPLHSVAQTRVLINTNLTNNQWKESPMKYNREDIKSGNQNSKMTPRVSTLESYTQHNPFP